MHRDDHAAPWVIHCDGSAVPNPGRMGLGAVVRAPDGTVAQQLSEATTFTGCNNEAELRALALALRWLRDHCASTSATPPHAVRVYSDNSVLVEQLDARRPPGPPIARLAPLFDEVRALMQAVGEVAVHWIPRHRNGEADALARGALGLVPKPATKHPTRTKKKQKRR